MKIIHIILILNLPLWGSTVYSQNEKDSLRIIWNDHNNPDSIRLEALNEFIHDYYLYTDPDSAIYFGELSGDIHSQNYSSPQRGRIFNTIGSAYDLKGNFESSSEYLRKSLNVFSRLNFKQGLGSVCGNLGNAFITIAEYDSALFYYEKSLKFNLEIKDTLGAAISQAGIGNLYYLKGKLKKSSEHFYKALKVFENIQHVNGSISCLHGIAMNFQRQEEFETAINFYERARSISVEHQVRAAEGISYLNLGNIYSELKEFDKALINLSTSEGIFRNLKMEAELAKVLNNIGGIYNDQSKYKESLKYFKESLRLSSKNENLDIKAVVLDNIARVYFKLQDYQKAISIARNALEIAGEIEALSTERVVYKTLHESFKNIGEYQESLNYLEQYVVAHDSLRNQDIRKNLLHNKYNYEYTLQAEKDSLRYANDKSESLLVQSSKYERQKWSIVTLSICGLSLFTIFLIIYRSKKRREIISNEAEAGRLRLAHFQSESKALRAQMNDHFLFNALGTIEQNIDEGKTDIAKKVTQDFMSLVRNILKNSNESEISLTDEIEVLSKFIEISGSGLENGIKHSFLFSDDLDTDEISVPPLLLQPFIENSIIHGFKSLDEKGIIEIKFEIKGDQLVVELKDNGRKFTKAKKSNDMNRKSYGIELVKERIRVRDEKYGTNSSLKTNLPGLDGRGFGVRLILAI